MPRRFLALNENVAQETNVYELGGNLLRIVTPTGKVFV